ncbi:RabGAP/TBC [Dendrothele bispora CBS 962.96]|uniref:RabGAP/TBC n=1 Tax=Dendrothele bispora (strain CBS 962.96) TaxID=1314807 RepID=A0A4S8LCI1_DENBC|nr:RabGAP/TBC [Dendrothele bispora CBS 962.96]
MVEIRREDLPQSPTKSPSGFDEEDKYRLVYTKSKVYVNPTAYARDNIPGFVALVKREATNPIYLLAWIPETLLNEKGTTEWDKFFKVEEKAALDQEDDDVVFIDLPTQRPESYAFSVPLTSIYSLLVHPPSFSSWYGSIGINLINGDTLPTLYFHDDESRSFTLPPPKPSRSAKRTSITSYPPPPSPVLPSKSSASWGGEDLIARLRCYAHVLPSVLQPSLYLIDPSRADLETHSTQIFDDDAVDDILAQSSYANSHSPVPTHRKPRPLSSPPGPTLAPNPYSHRSSVLHRSLGTASPSQSPSQARMALLQSFSNITRATRHAAQNILSHPLAKPIVPHLPDPVKTFVNANGEWEWGSWVEKGGVGEFESARVYLARWARIVAEEGERARRQEAQTLTTPSDVTEESSSLGIFELLHSTSNLPTPKSSRDPTHPVDDELWAKWFAEDGRPKIRIEEMKREVFRRGLSSQDGFRKRVWPFILGIHAWDVTEEEREKKWQEKKKKYQDLKNEWCGVPEVFDRQDVLEERHRIDVDCRRTDRTQPLFSTPTVTPSLSKSSEMDDEKVRFRRYSTISPNVVDIGAQSPSNEHIDRLAGILLTYNFYEKELGVSHHLRYDPTGIYTTTGYVQGMSDLCAPVYVVMEGEEEMTFWCFVEVMERMKQNFLRDQSGMRKQLSTLQQLIGVMDPELYRHFEKTDGLNLFFCFRWVLITFKREFPFEDVLRLWEVLWTDYYSNEFVLFVALAVLESHRDMILRYLVEFDEILKYCNELSMTIELDTTLAQAEVLFLSFAQLVADIDRRQAEEKSTEGLRHRRTNSLDSGIAKKTPNLSQDLKDLLKTGRQS